jgi:hypothetical protein
MENLLDKLNKMTMLAVALIVVSVSLLNFNDLRWQENIKSYVGIIIVFSIFAARFYVKWFLKK